MARQAIGVVGLGNMGGRIARRIRDAGRDVVGYDIAPENYARWGFDVPASLADALVPDIVFLSLPDASVVEKAMRGSDGILAQAHAGQTIIDLSTSDPVLTTALAEEATARGARYVDAGISGGAAAAEKGTLTIMVGGDDALREELLPYFEPFATRVVAMGVIGAGHAAKLLNNFLNAVALAATSEVMVAGAKAGLNLERLLEVLNNGSGVNFATLNRFPSIIKGDYLEGGLTSQLMMKDLRLYLDYLGRLGVPSLNSAGPVASFGLALHLGYGDEISNRVVDAIGDIAGRIRVQKEG